MPRGHPGRSARRRGTRLPPSGARGGATPVREASPAHEEPIGAARRPTLMLRSFVVISCLLAFALPANGTGGRPTRRSVDRRAWRTGSRSPATTPGHGRGGTLLPKAALFVPGGRDPTFLPSDGSWRGLMFEALTSVTVPQAHERPNHRVEPAASIVYGTIRA
jgi:hypothetical protein